MTTPDAVVLNGEGNSYGVHLLVDFGPIEEADKLLVECERYIDESQRELFFMPILPAFSSLVSNVRNWRVRRKDEKLQSIYKQLLPRILGCEKALRTIIGDVVEKKTALRLQAKHLVLRLESCVRFNEDLLHLSDDPLEITRTFVNNLSMELTNMKQLLLFNGEMIRFKDMEANAKKANALRWGGIAADRNMMRQQARLNPRLRMNNSKDRLNGLEALRDEDQLETEKKLKECRELREKFVVFLAQILEKRGVQQMNLDNCCWSLEALRAVVKREGISSSSISYSNNGSSSAPNSPMSNGNNSNNPDGLPSFDHARCTDCAYGYSMASDCISHLAALQKQAQDANKRLQALVEIRERMLEVSESMTIRLSETAATASSSGVATPPIAVTSTVVVVESTITTTTTTSMGDRGSSGSAGSVGNNNNNNHKEGIQEPDGKAKSEAAGGGS